MNNSPLKIIFNEDCIDLRENPENNTRSRKVANRFHHSINDLDLSNQAGSGSRNSLKKFPKASLKTGYVYDPFKKNSKEIANFKSISELSTVKNGLDTICTSSPILSCNNTESNGKVELYKNKFTMTKSRVGLKEGEKNKIKSKCFNKEQDSITELIENLDKEDTTVDHEPLWKDKRLSEKYSLLQVPWKRSRTFPLFSVSSSMKTAVNNQSENNSDKKTYLYDEGSEVDSAYLDSKRLLQNSFRFQNYLMTLLNLSAYLCALVIISLIIWLLSGNKYLYKLLIPKPPEDPVKKYVKYVGGGVLHFLTSVIRLFGTLLAIPTQELYQPNPDHSWPPHH